MKELIEELEKILALGTKQVTLTNKQLSMLLNYAKAQLQQAKSQAKKTRDAETKHIRLELYRSEAELKKVANRLEAARLWKAK